MFYDRAKIYVRSGSGGDGLISFRREKHVPRGGPNGGDGGRGGDIIFRVNPQLSSLVRFHRRNQYRASDGGHGGSNNKTGASGKSQILDVPPGTIIRDADTKALLSDLTSEEAKKTILSGRPQCRQINTALCRQRCPSQNRRLSIYNTRTKSGSCPAGRLSNVCPRRHTWFDRRRRIWRRSGSRVFATC
jgi:GTP-binding protein